MRIVTGDQGKTTAGRMALCAALMVLLAACDGMHPPAVSEEEAPAEPPKLTADMILVENEAAAELALGLPAPINLSRALRTRLETVMAQATRQESFKLTISQALPNATASADKWAEWLEETGGDVPSVLMVPHALALALEEKGLLQPFTLAEYLYLAQPGAQLVTSDSLPAPEAEASPEEAAEAPVIEALPDDYFDPKRDPLATAELAEPSQGFYLPFLHTALGLAAPAGGSLDVDKLQNWLTLFAGEPAGGLPYLVPREPAPELTWVSLIALRKSPNSLASADFTEVAELLHAPEFILTPMPAGYPVTEALAERKADLALVYGSQLSPAAVAEGRVLFAIPAEGSVRLAYDFVIPARAADPVTAQMFLAKIRETALTAELARALGMTPTLHPRARRQLAKEGAPILCILPEARQYYEPVNTQAHQQARLEVEKTFAHVLEARAAALPEVQPAAAMEEEETEPAPVPESGTPLMDAPPAEPMEIDLVPVTELPSGDANTPAGADSAMEPPGAPEPGAEPAPSPAEAVRVEGESSVPESPDNGETADSTDITLPGPEEMPAP